MAGDQVSALKIWQKLLERNPKDVAILLRLGVSQSLLGRYDEAKATFKRALGIRPNDPELLFNLGLMYFRKGDYDLAEKLINQTLALNPKYPEANYHLGRLCEQRGELDKALGFYLRELNFNPNSCSAWERVIVLRSKAPRREISSSFALVFFAACMGVSGMLWLVTRRVNNARDAAHSETSIIK